MSDKYISVSQRPHNFYGGGFIINSLSEYEKYKVIRPIVGDCTYDSNDMPTIRRTDISGLDWEHIYTTGIQNLSNRHDNSHYLIHMFRDDKKLLALWNNPLGKIALFRTCAAIATPDFSLYPSMNYNEIRHNVYMNRWLGTTWQNYGNTVIPTIGWAGPDTYDICLGAVEKGCPVIISTIGCQSHQEEFLSGFSEMKKRIEPPLIIVYGDMISGMTGRFINFRYKDSFRKDFIQLRLDGVSVISDIQGEI